jgi:hypothetical protein
MHRAEFEPTPPVFERAKVVHALDRANIVVGNEIRNVTETCLRTITQAKYEYK